MLMAQREAAPAPATSPEAVTRLWRERGLYMEALGEMNFRYEQKIRELSLLRQASETLRDCIDLDDVFRRLLALVLQELGISACSLYLADDSGDLVLRARCAREGAVEIFHPGIPGGLRVDPRRTPLGQTFMTGEVLVETAVPEGSLGWFPPDAQALLTAPLGPPSGCMGVLALHERHLEDVPDDVVRLLPILVTQATIAIENSALYQRLKQHSDTLEAKVRERTAALEHLNAELKAAAQQKSQFFTHFSHELRTPLNSILGFSELLLAQLHGTLTEHQARYVRRVLESGRQLLRLINDILDLAKVEAGKLSLQVQAVAVQAAVEQALAVMHPQAGAKHLRLCHEVPAGRPRVLADPTRFQQIMLNLLSNAVKFTPEGGTITISARQVRGREGTEETGNRSLGEEAAPVPPGSDSPIPGEPDFVEVAVSDSGVGIAPEDQARLFQDFEQLASSGCAHQGTGLGLSLTRRLVQLHGGQVGLTSVVGQGSRFWFTLPAAPPARGDEERRTSDGG
jgi:signal transduction histidine kinase